VPHIDLGDESWVAAPPARLLPRLRADELWRSWFPGVERDVFMDRGEKGVRWSVTGALVGSVEVWLEAFRAGTIVHWYVRADVPSGPAEPLRARCERAVNEGMFLVKDQVEGRGGGVTP
jgi:hypothetical protein